MIFNIKQKSIKCQYILYVYITVVEAMTVDIRADDLKNKVYIAL